MVKHKDQIARRIDHFIQEQLLPQISTAVSTNCVIDFALAYPNNDQQQQQQDDFKVTFASYSHTLAIQFKLKSLTIPKPVYITTHQQVYIVELNPFAEFAGTGLFSWVEDWETLMGEKPFEFRTHLEVRPPKAVYMTPSSSSSSSSSCLLKALTFASSSSSSSSPPGACWS